MTGISSFFCRSPGRNVEFAPLALVLLLPATVKVQIDYSRVIEMCAGAYGTIYGWRPEIDLYLSLLPGNYTRTKSTREPAGA